MDFKGDEESFYEYSSIDEDSFSENIKSNIKSDTQDTSEPENNIESVKPKSSNKLNAYLTEKINDLACKVKISSSDHSELKGQYNAIIANSNGGKIILELLSCTRFSIIVEIFEELKFGLIENYKDTYSNNFMQRLYNHLDTVRPTQVGLPYKLKYLEILLKGLVEVSSNKIGTFALQKLMDSFKTEQELDVLMFHLNELSESEILRMAYVSINLIMLFRMKMRFMF